MYLSSILGKREDIGVESFGLRVGPVAPRVLATSRSQLWRDANQDTGVPDDGRGSMDVCPEMTTEKILVVTPDYHSLTVNPTTGW